MKNDIENKLKQVRLYGAGGHSQVIRETLQLSGFDVAGYYDDYSYRKHHKVDVLQEGIKHNIDSFPHEGFPFIICIGNNKERAEIASLIESEFYRAIHPSVSISENVLIGMGTVVFAGSTIQTHTKIGKHVIINTGASIGHYNVIGDYAHISPKAVLSKYIEVGEGTHIGVNACVFPKVKIGKWCTIGAGTVVIEDVPDYATVVGNPGKIIKQNYPLRLNEINDLTFIGSGIATSFTLLNLLENIEEKVISTPVKISIVEKSNEFHTGIPYGKRSSDSVLLIKPLNKFLPHKELIKFVDWLCINKSWLIEDTLFCGGYLIQNWYTDNKNAINANMWDDLFVPRSFFGKYIRTLLDKKINYLKNKNQISIDFIQGNAINVEKIHDEFCISIADNSEVIKTKKVVLGVGSVPNRKLFSDLNLKNIEKKVLVIEDPYEGSLVGTLRRIKNFIYNTNGKKINVLIVGTNASAIELVYKLNDYSDIGLEINQFYTLSPQKKFPDFFIDYDNSIKFIPYNLTKLSELTTQITAIDIFEACKKDLDLAKDANISVIYSIGPISALLPVLINKLDKKEKEEFAAVYGNEIGKMQREAGAHYSKIIRNLEAEHKLVYLSGKFLNLDTQGTYPLVKYLSLNNDQRVITDQIDIIINCAGGQHINHPQNENTLLVNLSKNNICKINKSKKGFYVSDKMEASKGFYINGPLLSGNVVDEKPIWHVEHGGRISVFADKLAKVLSTAIFE